MTNYGTQSICNGKKFTVLGKIVHTISIKRVADWDETCKIRIRGWGGLLLQPTNEASTGLWSGLSEGHLGFHHLLWADLRGPGSGWAGRRPYQCCGNYHRCTWMLHPSLFLDPNLGRGLGTSLCCLAASQSWAETAESADVAEWPLWRSYWIRSFSSFWPSWASCRPRWPPTLFPAGLTPSWHKCGRSDEPDRTPTRPWESARPFPCCPTDEFNSIQDDGGAELLPKREFQLCQICQNLAQEIRILKVCDMLRNVTTRHGNVPCYRCDDVQNVLTELRDDSP